MYRAAARIGRAHIASVINTIILAYAGPSLPLLLLISIGEQPLGQALTNPMVTQEIIRSVVGTLGLISAVPITTALAALTQARQATSTDQPVQDQSDNDRPAHDQPGQPQPLNARHRRATDASWDSEPESVFWQTR
ncbi:YibE/F family protein [Nonomuraea sp. NPDC052129]|uniref:YibE/F family protein n=1 Tax=Nonomuraea sp. NPDC052129 TaxID=3154651 RepID=UPI003437102C